MTASEILAEMKALASDSYKRLLMKNHAVREPCFGVKIGDMKPLARRIKKNHDLALELYDTGNYDAMYFAGMIADDSRMTKKDLQRWADKAEGGALAGATVPSVAAGSPHGRAMAIKWIDSPKPKIAAIGWHTLAAIVSVEKDSELDLEELKRLLARVAETIHQQADPVRYAMNNFVIATGSFVSALTNEAKDAARTIGTLEVDMGPNSCEVPNAVDYIRKVEERGTIGRKRKSAKC